MIAHLSGKTIYRKSNSMILQVGGIGYKVFVQPDLESKAGDTVSLFIYENIKEDAYDLYGFVSIADLEMFEKLLSVNGVGPKVAMTILSVSNTEKVISAIEEQDFSFFEAIPGIGKKVAAKIIIDLKAKLENLKAVDFGASNVTEALVSLGFKKADIIKLLPKIPAELKDDESKIRFCLKHLSNFK